MQTKGRNMCHTPISIHMQMRVKLSFVCLLKNVNIYNEPNVNAKNNYRLIKDNADDERNVMCGRQSAALSLAHLFGYARAGRMRRRRRQVQWSAAQSVVALMNCPQMKKVKQKTLYLTVVLQLSRAEGQSSAFLTYHTRLTNALNTHIYYIFIHSSVYCLLFLFVNYTWLFFLQPPPLFSLSTHTFSCLFFRFLVFGFLYFVFLPTCSLIMPLLCLFACYCCFFGTWGKWKLSDGLAFITN